MIILDNVTKRYRTDDSVQVALDHVSPCFRDNEFVAMLHDSESSPAV